jgi:hypothetical protein
MNIRRRSGQQGTVDKGMSEPHLMTIKNAQSARVNGPTQARGLKNSVSQPASQGLTSIKNSISCPRDF